MGPSIHRGHVFDSLIQSDSRLVVATYALQANHPAVDCVGHSMLNNEVSDFNDSVAEHNEGNGLQRAVKQLRVELLSCV